MKIIATVFEKLPDPSILVIPNPSVDNSVMSGLGSEGVISRTIT
jgi:hypothetical protein